MSDEADLDRVDELISEAKVAAAETEGEMEAAPDPDADVTGRTDVERDAAETEAREVEDGTNGPGADG